MVKLTLTFENATEARRALANISDYGTRIQGNGEEGWIESIPRKGRLAKPLCSYEMEEVE